MPASPFNLPRTKKAADIRLTLIAVAQQSHDQAPTVPKKNLLCCGMLQPLVPAHGFAGEMLNGLNQIRCSRYTRHFLMGGTTLVE